VNFVFRLEINAGSFEVVQNTEGADLDGRKKVSFEIFCGSIAACDARWWSLGKPPYLRASGPRLPLKGNTPIGNLASCFKYSNGLEYCRTKLDLHS
jgi:hypothetical protein